MKVHMTRPNGGYIELDQVHARNLVAGEMYYAVSMLFNDLGEETPQHDTVYATASTAVSHQTGKPLILLRFLGTREDKSLSQVPYTNFFGPIRMEVTL